MSLYKRGGVWWAKFMIAGERYRKTTKMTNKNLARDKERDMISEIKSGAPPKPKPLALGEFLHDSFLPFVEVEFRQKPKTRDYYVFGARRLETGLLSKLELGQIDSEQINKFIHSLGDSLSPSTVNQTLRTLRRSLNVAVEWKKIPAAPKFSLLTERKREQVLDEEQEAAYLAATEEPWRTIATIWIKLGMRPGEIIRLRAEDLDWSTLEIQIRAGKSEAARRTLFMTGPVYKALSAHFERIGSPDEGWIFASQKDPARHASEKRIVDWHEQTLRRLFHARMSDPVMKSTYIEKSREPWRTIVILRDETGLRVADLVRLRHRDVHLSKRQFEIGRGEKTRKLRLTPSAFAALKTYLPRSRKISEWVFPASDPVHHVDRKRVRDWHAQTLKRMPGAFVPYVMRHTALTRLANSEGVSLTTVKAAAGHSSITVTQRYVHPQKNDIRKAFELMTGERIGDARRREILRPVGTGVGVGTKLGTVADVSSEVDSKEPQ
jgi:integrase